MELWFAFSVLAGVAALCLVRSYLPLTVRMALIAAVIWFGLVIFYAVPNIKGWPTNQELPENEVIIIAYVVDEPTSIYLWTGHIDTTAPKQFLQRLNPNNFILPEGDKPRCYEIPYSIQIHKKLEDAKKQAGKMGGILTAMRGKEKAEDRGGGRDEDEVKIRIINPVKLLPKDGNNR